MRIDEHVKICFSVLKQLQSELGIVFIAFFSSVTMSEKRISMLNFCKCLVFGHIMIYGAQLRINSVTVGGYLCKTMTSYQRRRSNAGSNYRTWPIFSPKNTHSLASCATTPIAGFLVCSTSGFRVECFKGGASHSTLCTGWIEHSWGMYTRPYFRIMGLFEHCEACLVLEGREDCPCEVAHCRSLAKLGNNT